MPHVEPNEELKRLFKQSEVTSWRALVMTYRMIFSILESRLQKRGCTVSRLQVMIALYFEGPMVPVRLANRMLVTRGNISTLLKRMQDEKLIEPLYSQGKDSRPAFVLTDEGRALFHELYPIHAANIVELMPSLAPEVVSPLFAIQENIHKKHKIGVPLARRKEFNT